VLRLAVDADAYDEHAAGVTRATKVRALAWVAGAVVGILLLLWGGMLLLAEYGGEVVDLRTADASGATFETRLWVVDVSGSAWLWAAAPERRWLQRLRTHPEVQIVRGGEVTRYRAVPVETNEARQRIGCLVVQRYGAAALALALIHQVLLRHAQDEAVPIRLEALEVNRSALPIGQPAAACATELSAKMVR